MAAYLILTLAMRRPLRLRSTEVKLPAPGFVPLQVGVGLLDWALAPATLYVLLPASAALAFLDARLRRHWNDELGIRLHAGFEAMALALHRDILPRLDRNCELTLMGHSLGAAEALILGLLLDHDGFRVSGVYTSGQPRITDAAGAIKYRNFPLLRIVNPDDPVPLLPGRGYRHLGPALVLLDGPYICYLPGDYQKERLSGAVWTNMEHGERIPEQLREHSIMDYLARLNPKLAGVVQVPFAERYRYLSDLRADDLN